MNILKKVDIKVLAIIFVGILLGGCTTLNKGNFGPFKRSLNNTSYGYRVIKDITGSAPTKYIEVFEVHPGDCSSNSGWNDCATDRERSELSGSKDNYPGDEFWYGWSIYVPKDYKNIYPSKTALGQFHQKGSHPVWMFQNSTGGLYLDNQVHGYTEKYYLLIPKKEFKGKWHTIKVHAKWSRGDDGFFYVWVDGKQKVKYKGPTMDVSQIYFKYGIYRSFLSRYKNRYKVQKVPAQKVYYSNVKRSYQEEGLLP